MTDGKHENIEAFWIDNDDLSQCEKNLMVTKSLKIKNGKIMDSFCKEKYEGYKCWREHKVKWLKNRENPENFRKSRDDRNRNKIFNHDSGKWSYGWTSLGRFDNATFDDLDRAKENFNLLLFDGAVMLATKIVIDQKSVINGFVINICHQLREAN